jgi:hypothetical protein
MSTNGFPGTLGAVRVRVWKEYLAQVGTGVLAGPSPPPPGLLVGPTLALTLTLTLGLRETGDPDGDLLRDGVGALVRPWVVGNRDLDAAAAGEVRDGDVDVDVDMDWVLDRDRDLVRVSDRDMDAGLGLGDAGAGADGEAGGDKAGDGVRGAELPVGGLSRGVVDGVLGRDPEVARRTNTQARTTHTQC